MRARSLLLYTTLATALAGCASTSGPERSTASAADLYRAGVEALESGERGEAKAKFDRLVETHPGSGHAGQAKAELAWIAYQAGDMTEARAVSGRLAEQQADHPAVPYALYVRAMAKEHEWEASQDDGPGDQQLARQAFGAYRDVAEHDAESEFAEKALEAMSRLRESVARHELALAEEQLAAGNYEEALDRARYVGEHYPRATSAADAMALQVSALREKGDDEAADQAEQILHLHHPDHQAASP